MGDVKHTPGVRIHKEASNVLVSCNSF